MKVIVRTDAKIMGNPVLIEIDAPDNMVEDKIKGDLRQFEYVMRYLIESLKKPGWIDQP